MNHKIIISIFFLLEKNGLNGKKDLNLLFLRANTDLYPNKFKSLIFYFTVNSKNSKVTKNRLTLFIIC